MNEYIERERLLRRFNIDDMMNVNGTLISLEDTRNTISNFPAADVAPVVHGCWIEYTKVIIPEPYNKWEQAWKCSECGFDDGFVAYNFCPNCGARMDLEVTDNG